MKFQFKQKVQQDLNPYDPNLADAKASGLGTFGGVYTPSVLTILGVIMYLRFGWVVGNVGLLGSFIIVTLATLITFLTALSVCAIATDRVVKVGGAYYMISRCLGIEVGGAVGISLYFAQALSIPLYTLGFAESVVQIFKSLNQTYVALVITILVAILALTSASLAVKAQYIIMGAIALSLLSLVFGGSIPDISPQAWDIPTDGESFWRVFAVFFPAVTGIMSGVSMSGDLRNPSRSIPIGTLAAVATGYIVYMLLPLILAMRVDTGTLVNEPLVMKMISLWSPAILFGVWGATLSSALGSILAAPRVLQALARDRILPRWLSFFGKGSGENDEPRIATCVTLSVAIAAVCVGDLNAIAPVLTMFFLTTYLVLNISASIEGFLRSPSFRPSFKVHWIWSLLGGIGCLWVMLLINPIATMVAAFIVVAIYFWLQQRELNTTWGDVRRGIWMALLRTGIFQLDSVEDTKNWRPNILVFSGSPSKRWSLIQLANIFTHKRGFITVSSVLPSASKDFGRQKDLENTIREHLKKQDVQALVRVVTAADPFEGMVQLVEIYGLGPLVPNTVLLGDSEDNNRRDRYCNTIVQLHQAKRSVMVLRENPEQGFGRYRCIDVWWGGMYANGSLMLLLAHLLRSTSEWRDAQIRLKLLVSKEGAAQNASANLNAMLNRLRIEAIPEVIVAANRSFETVLHESSNSADVIFLGMATPSKRDFREYYEKMHARTADLPTIIYVMAAPDFAFNEV
ncbi:amino acid permease [Mastigocoleus sp. MO_188.B34]|uniref:amino acid permease n=1 Tax=Mastigocoleus sp. MO_188.B34 TaxID=3036635 RepID=UPI002639F981|nr:amino acid permease [Mastigocoleus sp. MO_188.B34]MDJ0697116.1 amino acid permease [Mastigocoleus sp. MO_188.B34]